MQQQSRPNMSAFDNLLSMPSQQQNKTSLNAMKTPVMMPATQSAAKPTTNALSASDISDFLS